MLNNNQRKIVYYFNTGGMEGVGGRRHESIQYEGENDTIIFK